MSERDDLLILQRRVYNTPHGREVLVNELDELGLFGTFRSDPGSVALLNHAFRKLVLLGVDFQTREGRLAFVEAILGIEPQLDDPLTPTEEGK
jgi:hypothetical protein